MQVRTWLPATFVVLMMSGCGVLPGSAPAATPTSAPAVAAASPPPAVAASPAVSPVASPSAAVARATNTPAASAAKSVYVGNTDGEGVYLRKTPAMADRLQAYPDGTQLTLIGDDVDGDGQHWHHVRAPDGAEGYVPSMYTVDTPH